MNGWKNDPNGREPKVYKILAISLMALVGIVLVSPVIESSQDAIVGDAVITKTCWDRHGLFFPTRWSCRSSLHRLGPIGIGLSCAFNNNNSDLCKNLRQLSDQSRRERP